MEPDDGDTRSLTESFLLDFLARPASPPPIPAVPAQILLDAAPAPLLDPSTQLVPEMIDESFGALPASLMDYETHPPRLHTRTPELPTEAAPQQAVTSRGVEEEEDVAMEATLVEDEIDELESLEPPRHPVATTEDSTTVTAPALDKLAGTSPDPIQKSPIRASVPLEETLVQPSSSAAVARALLSPSKKPRRNSPSRDIEVEGQQPRSRGALHAQSSPGARGGLPETLSTEHRSNGDRAGPSETTPDAGSSSTISAFGDASFDGPVTSTPAFGFAAPPMPLTAARTLPNISLLPAPERQAAPAFIVPPPKPAGYYQSSAAAMAAILAKSPEKRRKEWYDDDEDDSIALEMVESLQSVTGSQLPADDTVAMSVDADGTKDMTMSISQGVPRAVLAHNQARESQQSLEYVDEAALLDSENRSTDDHPSTLDFPPGHQPTALSPRRSSPLSMVPTELVIASSARDGSDDGLMGLTGIGNLESSMEIPSQYVPEMTQLDAFRIAPTPQSSQEEDDEPAAQFEEVTDTLALAATSRGVGRRSAITSEADELLIEDTSGPASPNIVGPMAFSESPTNELEETIPATFEATVIHPISSFSKATDTISEPLNQATPQESSSSPQKSPTPAIQPSRVEHRAGSTIPEVEEPAYEPEPSPRPLPVPGAQAAAGDPDGEMVVEQADALGVPAHAVTLSKGKGKARFRSPSGSPDELDLFKKSQARARLDEQIGEMLEHVDETMVDFVETNIEEAPPVKRRKATFTLPPSRASTSSSKVQKRGRDTTSADDDDDPTGSSNRRRSLPAKKSKTSALARAKSLPTKKGGRRPARRASVLPTEPAASENDDSEEMGASMSAPFTRILGEWRDDKFFYPGTIVMVVGRDVQVLFDDESKAKLKFSEIRRCELRQGDYVRYRGDEIETETQADALAGDVRVVRVERGLTGEDALGELFQDDIVVASRPRVPATAAKDRLTLASICIPPERSTQLDDRKLTQDDIARLLGHRSASTSTSTSLLPAAPRTSSSSFTVTRTPNSLFEGVAFLVTRVDFSTPDIPSPRGGKKRAKSDDPAAQKASYARLLLANGATIIETSDLFTIDSSDADHLRIIFPTSSFVGIHTILLLADRPSTTPKFLVALALRIPCISREYVAACIDKGEQLDWKRFVITSGYLQHLRTHGVGGQLTALLKSTFDLASIEASHEDEPVLGAVSFLVVVPRKGKTPTEHEGAIHTLLTIFAAGGARKVDFVGSAAAAGAGKEYDYVLLEEGDALPDALMGHAGVANVEWAKQSLIAGELLDAARL